MQKWIIIGLSIVVVGLVLYLIFAPAKLIEQVKWKTTERVVYKTSATNSTITGATRITVKGDTQYVSGDNITIIATTTSTTTATVTTREKELQKYSESHIALLGCGIPFSDFGGGLEIKLDKYLIQGQYLVSRKEYVISAGIILLSW